MWQRHLMRHAGRFCSRPSTTRPIIACLSAARHPASIDSVRSGYEQIGHVQKRWSHICSLVERGAYDERFYQHVSGCEIKSLELVSDGRLLAVHWGDGKVSRFHSIWLKYTCFCPECRMDHTGQTKVNFEKASENSRIVSAADDGEGCVTVRWEDEPDHIGIYPIRFLKEHCYSKETLESKRESIRMTFSKDYVIPFVDYEEVASSSKGVYKWVKALNETGIAVVENVPCKLGMVKKLCQRIADEIQHTVYGETFQVVATPEPINAAYSSHELKLHMDQPMYEAPPGIQALHCLKFDSGITGGENVFVDLFQVAEVFREKHPEDFDVLCKVPVSYETLHFKREWPVHMRYQRPMIVTNRHGDLTGVVWHSHSLAPLQVEEEDVEPFLRAFGKFDTLLKNFPHRFRHRLREGDAVTFNNRRMTHGRAAFGSHQGERHLEGCYVEISEFKSCVHVLSNLEGGGRPVVRVGDYDMQ